MKTWRWYIVQPAHVVKKSVKLNIYAKRLVSYSIKQQVSRQSALNQHFSSDNHPQGSIQMTRKDVNQIDLNT